MLKSATCRIWWRMSFNKISFECCLPKAVNVYPKFPLLGDLLGQSRCKYSSSWWLYSKKQVDNYFGIGSELRRTCLLYKNKDEFKVLQKKLVQCFQVEGDNFLGRIITVGETWWYDYIQKVNKLVWNSRNKFKTVPSALSR